MKSFAITLLLLILFAAVALSMPHKEYGGERDCAGCHTLTIQEANAILSGIGEVKNVKISAVRGLFEITIENRGHRAVAYMDFSKKHLIPAPGFDVAQKRPLAEPSNPPRKPASVSINTIPTDNSIVMGNPAGKMKLFVFTDPDCPFCAKLHRELVKLMYMEPDVAIYVKMNPLKMHPNAFDKARVILGEKSLYMLDKAFAGEALPPPGANDPAKPVDDTVKLAESIGINSTPTLVLPDGRIMPGFRDAATIKELLTKAI